MSSGRNSGGNNRVGENLNKLKLVIIGFEEKLLAQFPVTGTVVSASDGVGLPGVTISEKGTINGTLTDAEGNSAKTKNGANLNIAIEWQGPDAMDTKLWFSKP